MTTEHQCPCGKKTFETVGSLIDGRWHCFTCAQKARESVTSKQLLADIRANHEAASGVRRACLNTGMTHSNWFVTAHDDREALLSYIDSFAPETDEERQRLIDEARILFPHCGDPPNETGDVLAQIRALLDQPVNHRLIVEQIDALVNSRRAEKTSARRDTGVTDENGKPLFEGDRVRVSWLAELAFRELDCEAIGTVTYMPDGITAAWFVKFDQLYRRSACESGVYETDSMMLIQTKGDEFTCHFEKITDDVKARLCPKCDRPPPPGGCDYCACPYPPVPRT